LRQRRFITSDVHLVLFLGDLNLQHMITSTAHVGGRRQTSLQPGGERMEPDRYLLLLLIGAAVLLAFVTVLQRI
jgi:hypothetical protein